MSTFEVSKRVAKAVGKLNSFKDNAKDKISYDKLAVKIEEIADEFGLSVDHLRVVSANEFNSLEKVIGYHERGERDKFLAKYVKMPETDKKRLKAIIGEVEELN